MKFHCGLDWKALGEAGEEFPEDNRIQEWLSNVREIYGDDRERWPKFGCGAKHKTVWTPQCSMVVELRVWPNAWYDGIRVSHRSEHMPTILQEMAEYHGICQGGGARRHS